MAQRESSFNDFASRKAAAKVPIPLWQILLIHLSSAIPDIVQFRQNFLCNCNMGFPEHSTLDFSTLDAPWLAALLR